MFPGEARLEATLHPVGIDCVEIRQVAGEVDPCQQASTPSGGRGAVKTWPQHRTESRVTLRFWGVQYIEQRPGEHAAGPVQRLRVEVIVRLVLACSVVRRYIRQIGETVPQTQEARAA